MSFFDRVRNWLGEEPTVPLIPIREHRSCKDDPCYYYETKDGYYGYCNKMGKNLRINLAPTCPLYLISMKSVYPEGSPRELFRAKETSILKAEDNTAVQTDSDTYVIMKTIMAYNISSVKPINEVFLSLDYDVGSGYYGYAKLTCQTPTVEEKTEAEITIDVSPKYNLVPLSREYYGDYVMQRLYLKHPGPAGYYAKNSLDKVYGRTVVEYEYK